MGEHITQTLPLKMWKYSSVRVCFKSYLGKWIDQWPWMLSSLNIINWCIYWTTSFSFLFWEQWDHRAWGTVHTVLIFLKQKKSEPWNYYLAVLVSIYKRKKKKNTPHSMTNRVVDKAHQSHDVNIGEWIKRRPPTPSIEQYKRTLTN